MKSTPGLSKSHSLLLQGSSVLSAAATLAWSAAAWAEEVHYAVPGQMGLQAGESPVAREVHFFHNGILLPLITVVSLVVLALLVWVMVRFNERANPVPSRTTHNAPLEVAWTVLPVLVLVIIAVPSFRLLNHQMILPKGDVTVKVTGKQWYWSYEYPKDEGGGFSFDSVMKPDTDLKPGDIRLLAVDNEAVVPVNKNIRLQITGADVIHSFIIQSFSVRMDAMPGRLNEAWFRAEKEGLYYGQCSKLCGKDHAFMPIAFRVVSEDAYKAWLAEGQKKFASREPSIQEPKTQLAAADASAPH